MASAGGVSLTSISQSAVTAKGNTRAARERFGLCLPCLLPGRLPSPFLLRRLLSGEGGAGVEPMQNESTFARTFAAAILGSG